MVGLILGIGGTKENLINSPNLKLKLDI